MSATDKQIGGTHYKTAIQPVQYIHANNLNFFEGNVIKYITRHRSKGGKADLEKAIHYIEMLMEFEYKEEQKHEVEPFIIDGLLEFNEEMQTLQVNIPDDTVIEKGIIIDGVTYPLNPDLYITAPERELNTCTGCIFNGNDNDCAVSGSILNHECYQKKIIYKSLKK